jgi:hypothetical protein
VRQPVAVARCQCRPCHVGGGADPQSWSPGCRVPAAASAVRCRCSPLSLACLGRIRIVATAASLCIADMRAQRTARLCAAAVGGGKATAPSHGTGMGRFGPQTPHRSGWCSVGEWVAVCREVLRISLSHMQVLFEHAHDAAVHEGARPVGI